MKSQTEPEYKKEYNKLKIVMDYVNSLPFIEGKFTKIKWGNSHPENEEHPILICEGEAFFKMEDRQYRLRLAANFLGLRRGGGYEGMHLCVSDLRQAFIDDDNNLDSIIENHNLDNMYRGVCHELVKRYNDDNLVFDGAAMSLGYQPIDALKVEEQTTKLFSATKSIINLVRNPKFREVVRNLENIISSYKERRMPGWVIVKK